MAQRYTGKEWGHRAALALMDECGGEDLWYVYRCAYKYTACGPAIGFLLQYTIHEDNGEGGPHNPGDQTVTEWRYCDDISTGIERTPYKANDEWMRGDDPAVVVLGVSVSSIVEGIDPCTDTIVLEGTDFTVKAFWDAVEATNRQANEMWDATHGCETCRKHWQGEGITTDEYGNELDWGSTPVWKGCPSCEGQGEII